MKIKEGKDSLCYSGFKMLAGNFMKASPDAKEVAGVAGV